MRLLTRLLASWTALLKASGSMIVSALGSGLDLLPLFLESLVGTTGYLGSSPVILVPVKSVGFRNVFFLLFLVCGFLFLFHTLLSPTDRLG